MKLPSTEFPVTLDLNKIYKPVEMAVKIDSSLKSQVQCGGAIFYSLYKHTSIKPRLAVQAQRLSRASKRLLPSSSRPGVS